MIRESRRKAKIEALKGLLSGNKTLRDIRQGQGLTMILECAGCLEDPGVLYDRQGHPLTADQLESRAATLREEGYLVFAETRSYNTKKELYGFIKK